MRGSESLAHPGGPRGSIQSTASPWGAALVLLPPSPEQDAVGTVYFSQLRFLNSYLSTLHPDMFYLVATALDFVFGDQLFHRATRRLPVSFKG